jgi:hypothetical protein
LVHGPVPRRSRRRFSSTRTEFSFPRAAVVRACRIEALLRAGSSQGAGIAQGPDSTCRALAKAQRCCKHQSSSPSQAAVLPVADTVSHATRRCPRQDECRCRLGARHRSRKFPGPSRTHSAQVNQLARFPPRRRRTRAAARGLGSEWAVGPCCTTQLTPRESRNHRVFDPTAPIVAGPSHESERATLNCCRQRPTCRNFALKEIEGIPTPRPHTYDPWPQYALARLRTKSLQTRHK